jgi:hypothetical protein
MHPMVPRPDVLSLVFLCFYWLNAVNGKIQKVNEKSVHGHFSGNSRKLKSLLPWGKSKGPQKSSRSSLTTKNEKVIFRQIISLLPSESRVSSEVIYNEKESDCFVP